MAPESSPQSTRFTRRSYSLCRHPTGTNVSDRHFTPSVGVVCAARTTSALYSTDGHAYYLPRLPTKSHVRTGLLSFSLQEEKTLHDGPQRVPKSRRSSCHRSTPRLQNSYLPARARAPLTPAPSFACSCSFAPAWVVHLAHQGPRGK